MKITAPLQIFALFVLVPTCSATAQTAPDKIEVVELPFGHSPRHGRNPPVDPILLDIEIYRKDVHFWRGQLDGRGTTVKLSTDAIAAENDCGIILVTSAASESGDGSDIDYTETMQIQLRYEQYDDRQPHIDLEFSYERPVAGIGPNGADCGYGVDRRITKLRHDFPINPGQEIAFEKHADFQIKVTRK